MAFVKPIEPGTERVSSATLRPFEGNSAILDNSIICFSVGVAVSTWLVPARTETVAVTVPTCMLTFSVNVWSVSSVTAFWTKVWKPVASMVKSYSVGRSESRT